MCEREFRPTGRWGIIVALERRPKRVVTPSVTATGVAAGGRAWVVIVAEFADGDALERIRVDNDPVAPAPVVEHAGRWKQRDKSGKARTSSLAR